VLASTSQALALCQLTLAAEGGTTDSVVLFDRRDYIAIQGFTTRVGQRFLVQVLRNGLVAGAASGIIKAGGLNEINHPGGA
jgi:adenosylcobinamide amidohydrolase